MTKVNLNHYTNLELQNYFTVKGISIAMKRNLFKARTRMLPVGLNFGKKSSCPICFLTDDDQSHLSQCMVIRVKSQLDQASIVPSVTNIFSENQDIIIGVAKSLQTLLRTRQVILENQ